MDNKENLKELKYLLYQAQEIKDTLRQSGNIYDSRKEDTAYSRSFVRSETYIDNLIQNIKNQLSSEDEWIEYEGTIELGVSDKDECVCCDGNHIFAKGVKWEENLKLPWGSFGASDIVHCSIPKVHSVEGKKIKMKVLKVKP